MEITRYKNKATYRDSIMIDGKRVRSPSFKRKSDLKAWKARMLSKVNKAKLYGHDLRIKERTTFQDYSMNWLESKVKVQKSQSTYANYERQLRLHFIPYIGHLFLDQISSRHADQLIERLTEKGHSNNGINEILQTLRTVLLDAEKNDFIRKSPLKHYPNLKVIKRAPTFWRELEIRQFLEHTKEHFLYPLYVVALNTGMRRGELAGLCWDRVDLARRMIEVSRIRDRYGLRETTKSGTTRHIPMNDTVLKVLEALHAEKRSKYVFVNTKGSEINQHHLYRDFKRAQVRAGMDNEIRFHDLRHSFASHFMMKGGNLYDLQKILGHTKYEMTQIYAHLSPDHLAQTTQILNFE